MIFKTSTDINGKVGNHVNSGLKNVFNGNFFAPQTFSLSEVLPSSDIETIKAYNAEFDRLKDITSKYGTNVSDATIAQKACQNTMGGASEKVKTLQANTNGGKIALDGLTKSSKAAELGMRALSVTGNMLLMTLVIKGISLLISGIDSWVHYIDNAKENAKEFVSSINDMNTEYNTNKKTINSLNKEYQILSEGVDNLGNNVNLTKDEFSRYHEITNQVAEMMPELVKGWDEQGNAILKVKGRITDLNEEYKKNQQNAAIEKWDDDKYDDVGVAYKSDATAKSYFNTSYDATDSTIASYSTKITSTAQILEQMQKIISGEISYKEMNKKREALYDKTDFTDEESAFSIAIDILKNSANLLSIRNADDYRLLQTKGEDVYNSARNNLNFATTKISNGMLGYAETIDEYWNSKYQTEINSFINSLITPELIANKNLQNTDSMKTFVDNLISDINTNKDGVTDALNGLFKLDVSKMNPKDASRKIKQFIDIIANILYKNPTKEQKTDLKKAFGFEEVDTTAKAYEESLTKTQKKYEKQEGNHFIWDNWFERNILTEDDISKWNKLLDKYQNASKARKAFEGENISASGFKKAWKGLDDPDNDDYKNTKKELTELAEKGKLTKKTFEDTTGAKSYFKSLGIDAETAVKYINLSVDGMKQLSSLKSGISSIQDAYSEKKENGIVQSNTLSSMEDEFGKLGKTWENYKKTLGSSTSTLSNCRDAQNKLAQAYLNSNDFLSNLVDENGKYDKQQRQIYINQLSAMGVKNAQKVVDSAILKATNSSITAYQGLTKQQKRNIKSVNDLKNKTSEEIISLMKQSGVTELAKNALADLAMQNTNWKDLDATGTYNQLINIAKAAGLSVSELSRVVALKDYINNRATKDSNYSQYGAVSDNTKRSESYYTKNAKKQLNKKLKKGQTVKFKIDIPDIGKSLDQINKDSSQNSNSKSNSKQEFDWIDRRVTVLTNKVSELNAEKENLFTVKKKNNNLNKQIKESTKLLGTYSTAYKKYKDKANSVKLGDSLKAKVRNGSITGSYSKLIVEYGETTANKIQKYMDYWDKAQNASKSWDETVKQIRELKIEKLQNQADDYNARATYRETLASRTNTSYKTQNSNINKQINFLNKSYYYQEKIAMLQGDIVEAKRLQLEAEQKEIELQKKKFDNIKTKYDQRLDTNSFYSDSIQGQMDIIEAKGQNIGNAYYQKQLSYSKSRISLLNEEKKKLLSNMSTMTKGTSEYYESLQTLRDINKELQEEKKNQIEINNSIAEGRQQRFEKGLENDSRLTSEIDTMLSLFEYEQSFDDDNGDWTEAGKSRLWAYNYDHSVNSSNANNAKAELDALNKLKKEGKYGEKYTYTSLEKLNEAIENASDKYQESVKEAYDSETKIVDLVKEYYQKQIDVLQDLIDKRKEALETEKDLYDYQKSIAEKTKNINTIKKQIAAYQGDTSEETKAKLQKLQVSLNEAQKDLKDTEYDRYISDQQKLLDNLLKEYQDFIEPILNDFKALLQEGLNLQLDENGSYIKKKAAEEGYVDSGNVTTGNSTTSGKKDANTQYTTAQKVNNTPAKITDPKNQVKEKAKTKQDVMNWLKKKNVTKKSGYEHLSFPERGKKYDKGNKNIQKLITVTSTHYNGKKNVKTKVGLVLSSSEIKELANFLGVKGNGSKFGSSSPLYKKLKSLGVKGFSRGGIVDIDSLDKQVKANGDTALISAKKGEGILTPEQTQMFMKFIGKLDNYDSITPNMDLYNNGIKTLTTANNVNYGNVSFNFEMNGINNPDEFIHELQTSPKFQKAIQSVSVDRLNGGGRLSVNRIK